MTTEQQTKVNNVIAKLAGTPSGMEMLHEAMKASGLSLLRIATLEGFVPVTDPVRIANAKTGVILDTETTGFDPENDEIIELAMLKFTYDDQGIIALVDLYDEFNEPSSPIPEEVTKITGITDDMVKGHKINPDEVRAFLDGCSITLAHNAAFDRKFVEFHLPKSGFDTIDWHCTLEQVDWLSRGKSGRSLEVLALSEGLTYGSHRADADIIATAYVLRSENGEGVSAFSEMLRNGAQPTILIIAKDTPFNIPKSSPLYEPAKPKTAAGDFLKERGYRWSPDGEDVYKACDKGWHRQIFGDVESIQEEADFLRGIYGRDVSVPSFRISAEHRYSKRRPGEVELFRTAEVRELKDAAFQVELERQPSLDI